MLELDEVSSPNGAGKSTAVRAVFSLVSLDSGALRWSGAPMPASARARFGYMPEERGCLTGGRPAVRGSASSAAGLGTPGRRHPPSHPNVSLPKVERT